MGRIRPDVLLVYQGYEAMQKLILFATFILVDSRRTLLGDIVAVPYRKGFILNGLKVNYSLATI